MSAASTARLAARTALDGCLAMAVTRDSVTVSTSSSGTQRFARPSLAASGPSTSLPVYSRSRATPGLDSRAIRAANAALARIPQRAIGMPMRDRSPITRRSHAHASWQPAPAATPRTPAMAGTGRRSIAVNAASIRAKLSSTCRGPALAHSRMSDPALKAAWPAPVNTTARSCWPAARACTLAVSSAQSPLRRTLPRRPVPSTMRAMVPSRVMVTSINVLPPPRAWPRCRRPDSRARRGPRRCAGPRRAARAGRRQGCR